MILQSNKFNALKKKTLQEPVNIQMEKIEDKIK